MYSTCTQYTVLEMLRYHGFRNRGCQKGAFSGGNADCSKSALLFSSRFGQALGLVAPGVLQKQPSDIIGYDWR